MLSAEATFRNASAISVGKRQFLSKETEWRRDGALQGTASHAPVRKGWSQVNETVKGLSIHAEDSWEVSVDVNPPAIAPTPVFTAGVRVYIPPHWALPEGGVVFCSAEITYRANSASWWPSVDAISNINVFAAGFTIYKVARSIIQDRGANRQVILAFIAKWVSEAPSRYLDIDADCSMTGWPGSGGFGVDVDLTAFGQELAFRRDTKQFTWPDYQETVSLGDWEVV